MPDFVAQAKSIQQKIVEWRRELHKIPEVGLDLPETSAFVSKVLTELGIEHRTKVGVSGIVGLIKGGKPGKTIMLRADMDALALKEETGLPFTSTNENMHACGHDSHTAMLLGAAKVLIENRQQLTGNVKLIFQPAEEGPGGAKPMIDDGAMDNPRVDAALGLHIGCLFKEIGNGQVGVHYGNIMACLDKFYIKLKGHGCHGATPEAGIDPIPIAGQVIGALQTIVSRETKPTRPAVVTIGQIHGGRTYNIIPDTVELEGTARAVDQGIRENIARRIEEVVAGIAKGMGGDYEYKYTFGYPPVVNDAGFTKAFVESAKKVVGPENIIEITEPTMGGEDMAYYLERVPGTFFFLGSINEAKGIIHPHHNPKFDVDEDVFWIGTALMVQGAVDWLENNK